MSTTRLTKIKLPSIALGSEIPKIVHQTYRTRDLPEEISCSIDEMQRLNPEWEFRFYDDSDVRTYVRTAYGADVLAYVDAINSQYAAARADLFRYLLMYREGGLYLDIKSKATRPLNEVVMPCDRFLLSQWRNGPESSFSTWGLHPELKFVEGGEYQQWFIISAPGHPFMRAAAAGAIENLRRYHPLLQSVGKPAVVRTTGPIAFTRAIYPIRNLHPCRQVDSEADLGLLYSIYPQQDHESALANHYSQADEALVGGSPLSSLSVWLRRRGRRLRSLAAGLKSKR